MKTNSCFILIIILLVWLLAPTATTGQKILQEVSGRINDAASGRPVEGANVLLKSLDGLPDKGLATPVSGKFSFPDVQLGQYVLTVSHLGFKYYQSQVFRVSASRKSEHEIAIEPGIQIMDELVISSPIPGISSIGKRSLTVEQTQRFAATFYDPARLSTSYPGVSTINDQNNNIVVRGNSPNGVLWRLEGVDILNPNHLTNAGTFSDRPAQNGGSVNILSTQLLGNSAFLNGAFDSRYGDALSGVFDMYLRPGNIEGTKFTGQISLLGTDVAIEGPIGSGSVSYLANYRYSTVGILEAIGVPLGDESINFQDLSFHISGNTVAGGRWSVFGIGGVSHNLFSGERDSTLWEVEKDRKDIDFRGKMGGAGMSYDWITGDRSKISSTIAYSATRNTREEWIIADDLSLARAATDRDESELISWNAEFSYGFSESLLQTGYHLNRRTDQILSRNDLNGVSAAQGAGEYWVFQPYFNLSRDVSETISYQVGMRVPYETLSSTLYIEPRIRLQWAPSSKVGFYTGFGRHSMHQLPGVYYGNTATLGIANDNRDLQFTRADHVLLGLSAGINHLKITVEGYYQDLFNVPVASTINSFSTLNQIQGFTDFTLVNDGKGRNYGVDVQVERSLSEGVYYLVNGSLYSSRYVGSDEIWRRSRFDGGYAFNLTTGKEFKGKHPTKNRTFGANLKTVWLGGYRDTPVDAVASNQAGSTVYDITNTWAVKMADYFRIDIRLIWSRNKPGYTRSISLDIQNLLNATNPAFSYYDMETQSIVVQNQLGIIPVITYRIEF